MKYSTIDDLVAAIAVRAGQLSMLSMNNLRAAYPETTETRTELVRHVREMGYSKADCVEAILMEEFENAQIID